MNRIVRATAVILLMALPLLSACSAPGGAAAERDLHPRQVSVRVFYDGSPTPNVLVNVPLRAVTTAMRIASLARAFGTRIEIGGDGEDRGHTLRLDGVDLEALRAAILEMQPGLVVQLEEGGERVEIWID